MGDETRGADWLTIDEACAYLRVQPRILDRLEALGSPRADGQPTIGASWQRRRIGGVQDGHPFKTQALDDLRAQQRQDVRSVPQWLLDRMALHEATPPTLDDERSAMAECLLRDLAVEHREAAGLLLDFDAGWRHESTDLLLHIITGTLQDANPDGLARRQSRLLKEAEEAAADALLSRLPDAGRRELTQLERYLLLCVLADHYADDGYRDPRLRRS